MQTIDLNQDFVSLIHEVREHRKKSIVCYSAQEGFDINQQLLKIINNDSYKEDYQLITTVLLFHKVSYEEVIETIKKIIAYNIF